MKKPLFKLIIILALANCLQIYSMHTTKRYFIKYVPSIWMQRIQEIANEIKNKHGDTCKDYHKANAIVQWLQEIAKYVKEDLKVGNDLVMNTGELDTLNSKLNRLCTRNAITPVKISPSIMYDYNEPYTSPFLNEELSNPKTSKDNS